MRRVPLVVALVLLALVWGGPLTAWAGAGFTAHMVRHMALVAVIAPLLVLALPRLARAVAPNAAVAAAVEFAVVWGWHLPAAHDAAVLSPLTYGLEQASFLLAGLAVWAGALAAREPLAGAGALLLTSMHMTALGALLILAPRVLFADCAGLAQQQTGGLLMLALGTPVYLAGGLWLASRSLRESAA
ncbi:cytochrome c oxidase assembly protein [Wenxinia saemankumensis]|uniref:Putative membrane protein n=1 Tax=Wenxinia saemankumensis TaxID=1447782 RepID=A0A1M6HBL3_9RHOB|nr:cytochrome c oxidase assembly protein [Wenxinia saemankumensis]SHJ19617.1 putative membrane protein [Wenxinia saemankumensis]